MSRKTTTVKKADDADVYCLPEGKHGISSGMTPSQTMAKLVIRSALSASTAKLYLSTTDDLQVSDLLTEMENTGQEVNDGKLTQAEQMLANQAIVLDAIFNNLAQRAARAEHMKSTETYLRLALKSQAQARATIEALAAIKTPRSYIRQANIAQGHQQVNNNMYASASEHTCVIESKNLPNKLLEADHERLDIGTASTPSRVDTAMAALDRIDRAKD